MRFRYWLLTIVLVDALCCYAHLCAHTYYETVKHVEEEHVTPKTNYYPPEE